MRKRLLALLTVMVVFVLPTMTVFAHPNAQEHYDELEQVLFGRRYAGRNRDALTIIQYASTLAIDQFNGFHGSLLAHLNNCKVPDLPPDVKATPSENRRGINYTASAHTHREATHRGWDWSYGSNDKANWSVRKNILLASVNQVFGFRRFLGRYDKQCNSFCALIYYVHMIGDHQEDSTYKADGPIISLAERHYGASSIDIFYELERHLTVLFEGQANTRVFKNMMGSLRRLASNARALTGSIGGINTPDKLAQYHQHAKDLISILSEGVPLLLSREAFFIKAFPID